MIRRKERRMNRVVRRVLRLQLVAPAVIIGLISHVPCASAQNISVGGHGGADISVLPVKRVLGLEVAWQFAPSLRVRAAGSEVQAQQPSDYLGTTVEWQPVQSRVRPYVGVGGTYASLPGGWSSRNVVTWMALGGIEAMTPIGSPYLEIRVNGIGGSSEQVVVGWRVTP
jgi:hypothetical protein